MRRSGWWIAVALVAAACGDDDPETTPIDNSGGETPSNPTNPGTPGGGGSGTTEPDPEPVVRSFEVPADEGQPMSASNSASLTYIEFPALDNDSDEYLVVHFGGPGSSAVSLAPDVLEFFPREVRERYTILGIDEIGVANSEPFECETPGVDASTTPELGNEDQEEELLDAFADDFERCQQSEPLLLEASTERYARDIERLRVELGISSLSFLGFSYGTQVAMTYAALFPEQTDRIALDSVVDPRIAFSTQSVDQVEARVDAYEAFFEWCDDETDCSITREGLNTLAAQVEASGTQAELAGFNFLVSSLNTEPVWELLGLILSNVGSDFSIFADFAGAGGLGSFNFLAFIATSCMESPPATLEALRSDRTAFVDGYTSELDAEFFFEGQFVISYLCLAWEPRDVSIDWEEAFATIDEEIDVLIVGATGDTQTPLAWTESVAMSLPDAARITIPEVSHAIGFQGANDCVDSAIRDFLLGEDVPDGECAKSVIPEGDDDALSVFPQLPRPSWL